MLILPSHFTGISFNLKVSKVLWVLHHVWFQFRFDIDPNESDAIIVLTQKTGDGYNRHMTSIGFVLYLVHAFFSFMSQRLAVLRVILSLLGANPNSQNDVFITGN